MAITIADGGLAEGGAVIELSDGTKYAIFVAANVLEVWKDIDGTPSLVDSDTAITIFGGNIFRFCHAALRSDDDIAIVCACAEDRTRDIVYAILDTSTGIIGAWEEAASYTNGTTGIYQGCFISIDSNDYPHILYANSVNYHGTGYNQIYHAWNDGSWNTEVVCSDPQESYREPRVTCCPADDLEVLYYSYTDTDVKYQRRNGSWPGESVYSEAAAWLGSVVCTAGDTVYRYHVAGSINIEENNVDTGYDITAANIGHWPALANSTRYVFFRNADRDIQLISNDGGGWTDEGDLQVGTFFRVIAEWAYLNEHQSGEINYIFTDGTNVYYDSFSLVPAGPAGIKTVNDLAIASIKTINDLAIASIKTISDVA